MYGADLLIQFQAPEEKAVFMKWLNKEGFDAFLKSKLNTSSISCLASFEIGATGKEEDFTDEDGFIEFE